MLKSTRKSSGGRVYFGLLALLLLTGCNTDQSITGSVPTDYRERHPIRLSEGQRSIQLLIGSGRGDLTAEQRAQVTTLASTWRKEGTGIILIDMPVGTPNERAARYAAREVQSLLKASGVPPRGIAARKYQPPQTEEFGPLRIAYAQIEAKAGPCGEWPEDIGAAFSPRIQAVPPSIDNRPYWNFGCSTQQNLAAMVANPQDLVQPRAETPAYAARRQQVIDKYRQGQDTSTQYAKPGDAKISDVGK